MNAKPSFMGRAVLAILLTIGFYGLALAIVAGLLFLVYLDLQDKNVHWRVVAGALIAAGTILWAILPRPDRFVPPGPRLEPDRHPRLFDLVRNVAQRMSQPIPSEVYLVPDVNAFVSERGGILGIGSKRVMGIGLPLLQSMTISQIRAVLAHEFGHYYSGDTKLAPWVYKTREAIIRTIQGLGEKSWLHLPFRVVIKK